MKSEQRISSTSTLVAAQQWLAATFNEGGPFTIGVKPRRRKLSSNALSHVWYTELSKQRCDLSAAEYKQLCKLDHGAPILVRDSQKFRNFWESFFVNLSRPEQLAAMKYISISSLLTPKQFNEYLNQIVMQYAPEGVVLTSLKEADL